jgi:hypothetical protein
MHFELTPSGLLTVGSFSLTIAGLVVRLFLKDKDISPERHLITAALFFALVAGGLFSVSSIQRSHEIRRLGERILVELGSSEKTYDQLLVDLYRADPRLFSAAFESLWAEGRIDNRLESIRLGDREALVVRLWRVR